ncbi:C6 zinc finger domain-containing protein [Verticillium dahliae VdLs.17]|uniref:C6 zinc finger domain-containing protein n=1 Tax=Verticillium dahliae (strain VdLs.17 / ATCC MYA-4575 / FGSC 10137) TaxID=498257 RepID=G2WQY4_VERDV|nr:C6 zinc finger domain-containing protein [Verticillium dahliae VdLs.17]EGY14083.1 C6 zinc finger domain-containing protein [Verticillium dahliae VdLs.17]
MPDGTISSLSPSSPLSISIPRSKHKKKRTRTGCLNCRRKKRKCDEAHPACGGCARRREVCRWGLKVTFRDENAQTICRDHPSMKAPKRRPKGFEILDVTDEVIREYHNPIDFEVDSEEGESPRCQAVPSPVRRRYEEPRGNRQLCLPMESANLRNQEPTDLADFGDSPSAASHIITDSAVANLLLFSQGGANASHDLASSLSQHTQFDSLERLPVNPIVHESPSLEHVFEFGEQLFSPEGSYDDGIFLPGSAYHELHSTLRNHLIQEVRSNVPTRPGTPTQGVENVYKEHSVRSGTSSTNDEVFIQNDLASDHEPPRLSKQEEIVLWKNWFEEISPWLDKFDNQCNFQNVLPTIARDHDHLRYSMLALSARQLELKDSNRATDRSLALYQEAIHLLLPQLSTRTTPVIASCVVLCVLEIPSSPPPAGPAPRAAPSSSLDADVVLLSARSTTFDMWANYSVYLVAQVLDLLAPLAAAKPGRPLLRRAPQRRRLPHVVGAPMAARRGLARPSPARDAPRPRDAVDALGPVPDRPLQQCSRRVGQPAAPHGRAADAAEPPAGPEARAAPEVGPLARAADLRDQHDEPPPRRVDE